jgi:hypothetical protein
MQVLLTIAQCHGIVIGNVICMLFFVPFRFELTTSFNRIFQWIRNEQYMPASSNPISVKSSPPMFTDCLRLLPLEGGTA